MARKGTPEERRAARIERRRNNEVTFVRTRARKVVEAGKGGHQLVVVACNAALAASKRITDEARQDLARALVETVERFDVDNNRKVQP